MTYIIKKIEKKIYYKFFKKNKISYSFLNFFVKNSNSNFIKKYLIEVGLLKKVNKKGNE